MSSVPPPAQPPSSAGDPAPYSAADQNTYTSASGPSAPSALGKPDIGTTISTSFGWAWKAFTKNWMALVIPAIVYTLAIAIVLGVAVGAPMAAMIASTDPYTGDVEPGASAGVLAGTVIGSLITLVLAALWMSGMYNVVGKVMRGEKPTLGNGFIGPVTVILVAIVVGILSSIGYALFVIPGLIVTVLMLFAAVAAARGASVGEALKSSFTTAKENLGATIVLALLVYVLGLVGSAVVIGALITVPLSALLLGAAFEVLNRRALPEPR